MNTHTTLSDDSLNEISAGGFATMTHGIPKIFVYDKSEAAAQKADKAITAIPAGSLSYAAFC